MDSDLQLRQPKPPPPQQQHAPPPPNAPQDRKNKEGPEVTGHGKRDEQGEITGQGRPRSPKTVPSAEGGEGKDKRKRINVVVRSPCQDNDPADAHTGAHKSVLQSANPVWTRSVHLDAPGQRHRCAALLETLTPMTDHCLVTSGGGEGLVGASARAQPPTHPQTLLGPCVQFPQEQLQAISSNSLQHGGANGGPSPQQGAVLPPPPPCGKSNACVRATAGVFSVKLWDYGVALPKGGGGLRPRVVQKRPRERPLPLPLHFPCRYPISVPIH